MKKEIEVFDYAKEIILGMKKGVLITVKSGENVNPMTIAWGALGIEWKKPIFTAYIRESRFTKEILDETNEFTVNIPVGDYDKNIISFCGTKSGRDFDKVKELGLTLVDSETISTPAIKELPLTLECKVLYKQEQDAEKFPEDVRENCYPSNMEGLKSGRKRDYHTVYYAEIMKAYIIE